MGFKKFLNPLKYTSLDFNGISVSRLGDECYQMMAEDTPVVE